jgi:hypothetical protein
MAFLGGIKNVVITFGTCFKYVPPSFGGFKDANIK